MTSTESERLRGLVAKWRQSQYKHQGVNLYHEETWQDGRVFCADELEAALSDVPAPDAGAREAAARLDEARWWAMQQMHGHALFQPNCQFCERLAALERAALAGAAQPAPKDQRQLRKCSILYCFKPAFVETGFCEQHAVGGPAQPAPDPRQVRKCGLSYCFKPAVPETGFCEQHSGKLAAQPTPVCSTCHGMGRLGRFDGFGDVACPDCGKNTAQPAPPKCDCQPTHSGSVYDEPAPPKDAK